MDVVAGQTPGYENLEVYLNGKRLDHCVEASEQKGIAVVLRTNSKGKIVIVKDDSSDLEVDRMTLRGNVEVRRRK